MAGSGEVKRSVHHRIADDLRAAIRAGEYHDGDRLPGENEIMKRYGVARVTSREALAVLRNEGLAGARGAGGGRDRGARAGPPSPRRDPRR